MMTPSDVAYLTFVRWRYRHHDTSYAYRIGSPKLGGAGER